MRLRKLSEVELERSTQLARQSEKKAIQNILDHLEEVQRRRLFAKRGFSSLLKYAVHTLGYSEREAMLRIDAMRLTQDVPEVKEKIMKGSLTLTQASQVQGFLRREKKISQKSYNQSQKLDLLKTIESKSTRETEKKLVDISPRAMAPAKDHVKAVAPQMDQFSFWASQELKKRLEELKALGGPRFKTGSLSELIEFAVESSIEQLKDQQTPKQRRNDSTAKSVTKRVRYEIKQEAGFRCEYRDPRTQRRCDARAHLEIEHCKPQALGMDHRKNNLRCLCSAHNKLMAVQTLGMAKMGRYLQN